jgi:GTP-binding protein
MFTVAIVGRPNVGKSTLFNRIIGQKQAIIDDLSGVTRDRIYGESEWNGKKFNIIDTGGFVPHSDDVFESAIREQVAIAMEEASLLLFMVDVTTGITDLDDAVADLLRKSEKDVLVVVNKVDNSERLYAANEFYSLGFEELYFLSSISGSGTGELMDAIADRIPEGEEEEKSELRRVAIVGQPNVGKSSLVNALIGEERQIVTDIAGTTRDSIHTRFNKFSKDFLLIDTAGIRKKTKVRENLEFYSVIRAINSIDEADICVLMIDATQGVESQDLNIFRLAVKKRRGVIICINKWDLVEKETNTARDYEEGVRKKFAPFSDLPILFTSVKEKQRVLKLLDLISEVGENQQRKISTSELNDKMQEAIQAYPPPSVKGKHIKIKYVTQLPTRVPSFAFFCNHPKYIKQPYRNYLENKLRSFYNFTGVPINVYFRQK